MNALVSTFTQKRMSLLCCAVTLLLLALPIQTLALSAEQKRVLQSGVYYYDVEVSGSAECLGGPAAGGPIYSPAFPAVSDISVLTKNIEDYIKGKKPAATFGNYANDIVRLGQQYNVNPVLLVAVAQKETNFGTDGGRGNPPNHNFWGNTSRTEPYASYTDAIDAYYKNLRTNSYYKEVWDKGEAATVDEIIEKATPSSDPRNDTVGYIAFVRDLIQKIIGSPSSSGTSSACPSGSGGSGLVNADGYAWPVAPQKKSENGTTPDLSAVPCRATTCHHDNTAAFDLGRQPGGDSAAGTPLYAIGDGHVENINVYNDITGCYSLQLKSSKDNMWYWYAHIQNVSVEDGATVKAGQQIAEIGLRKCTGNGSTSHLHIDRGCIQNGVPQKGGRDSCRDPDFVPFMNQLFESLPA